MNSPIWPLGTSFFSILSLAVPRYLSASNTCSPASKIDGTGDILEIQAAAEADESPLGEPVSFHKQLLDDLQIPECHGRSQGVFVSALEYLFFLLNSPDRLCARRDQCALRPRLPPQRRAAKLHRRGAQPQCAPAQARAKHKSALRTFRADAVRPWRNGSCLRRRTIGRSANNFLPT